MAKSVSRVRRLLRIIAANIGKKALQLLLQHVYDVNLCDLAEKALREKLNVGHVNQSITDTKIARKAVLTIVEDDAEGLLVEDSAVPEQETQVPQDVEQVPQDVEQVPPSPDAIAAFILASGVDLSSIQAAIEQKQVEDSTDQ